MKKCFKCGKIKEKSEFYSHPQMKDCLLGKCKECTKNDVRQNRQENERAREYDRERAKTPERKKFLSDAQKRRRAKYPEKNKAYLKVYRAIKKGILKKENCCYCGQIAEAHHDDYSKPLDVKWLCKKHHEKRHQQLGWG